MGRWLPFLLLLAVTLVVTGPYLIPGRALMAAHTDCYEPWSGEASIQECEEARSKANKLLTDKLFMFHPEVQLTRESLRSGVLPAWNPYVLGGLPHIATGIPATFSPTMILHLLFSPFPAYGLGAFLHMLVAGLFFYLFLRARGLSQWAGLFGAVCFAFGGWMAARLEYYQIAGAAAWIPMALYGLEKVLAAGRWRHAAFLALGVGGSLLSGFPQISIEALYFMGAYALVRSFDLWKSGGAPLALRRLLGCSLAIGLGILIAAPQMLPSVAFTFSGTSTRSLVGFDPIRLRSMNPNALCLFLLPSILGHPYLPSWAQSPYNPSRTLLGEAWFGFHSNFNETTVFMGILTVCVIIGSLRALRNRTAIFLWIAALAGVLASCDTFLLKLCYYLPGLNIGDPKRFLFITILALSGLSAMAFDGHLRRTGELKSSMGPAFAGFGLGMAAAVVAFWLQSGSHCHDFLLAGLVDRFGVSREQAMDFLGEERLEGTAWHLLFSLWTLAGTAFAAGCIMAVSGWSRMPLGMRAAFPLLFLIGELCFFAYGANQAQRTEDFYRPTPLVSFLEARREEQGPFRIVRFRDADVGFEALFPPKLPMIAGIEDVQGYVAIYLKRYRNLIEGLEKGLTESVGIRSFKEEATLSSPLVDLLGARYVLCRKAPEPLPPNFRSVGFLGGGTLLENLEALPRAFVVSRIKPVKTPEEALAAVLDSAFEPGLEAVVEGGAEIPAPFETGTNPGKAVITRRSLTEVEVVVESQGGLLVLTENHAPGWKAEVDGEPAPILRTDYAFRGVPLAPGVHTVIFRYRSTPITLGLLLGIVGMAGVFFMILKRPGSGRAPPSAQGNPPLED